jgi:cell division protein FtsB
VGTDERHIAPIDEGGVALAAIQGLNEKLEARSQKLEAENAELKAQMAELKALVQQLAQPK